MCKYLGITRPTKSLTSLRAVGGNIKKIALLSPYNITEKLIEKRLALLEENVAPGRGYQTARINLAALKMELINLDSIKVKLKG